MSNITEETKIGELIPEGCTLKQVVDNNACDPDYRTIYIHLKKAKTPEQLANEEAKKLGFKIGDKVWEISSRNYYGTINEFKLCNNYVIILTSTGWSCKHEILTNKVAIYCPTKEKYEYIMEQLKYQIVTINNQYQTQLVYVNGNTWSSTGLKDNLSNYLIISVDSYCEAMDIKPLFVTEDKVNVYNPEQWVYRLNTSLSKPMEYIDKYLVETEIALIQRDNPKHLKWFSTQQAAQQYLDNLKLQEIIKDYPIGTEIENTDGKIYKVLTPPRWRRWNSEGINNAITTEWKQGYDIVIYGDNGYLAKKINPILFYTEDFKDGSFPVKSCSNCSHIDCIYKFTSKEQPSNCWTNYIELKGEPIRKGDKCWKVGIFNGTHICKYSDWNSTGDMYFKYFSDETNARNYYNKLVEESKPKPLTKEEKLALYKLRQTLVCQLENTCWNSLRLCTRDRIIEIDKQLFD